MKYSQLFPKTLRQTPAGAESINHQLLVRGGFIDQLMAGSWTLLPLGVRVLQKINDIIRDELNKTGAQEMSMPLLHPKEIWEETGRWNKPEVKEVMFQFKDQVREREYGLAFTHEEIVLDEIRKHLQSYKDLPIKLYHFTNKFRNEPRAKSGILRGREFLMKDLYSAHVSNEDLTEYYEQVKRSYLEIFKRIGIKVMVAEASGGVFTKEFSHEFQAPSEVGEDTIYYCEECDFVQNKEVFEGQEGEKCIRCGKGVIKSTMAIEVGNIFRLGIQFAQEMKVLFADEKGEQKPVHFASYGIGPTRVMGTIVEVSHDDKGIIWPDSVAPYMVHLIGLDLTDSKIKKEAEKIYKYLQDEGIEVLFDDREAVSVGEKFADADLIGIPFRVVISKKTGEKLEIKRRDEKETRFLTLEELIKELKI